MKSVKYILPFILFNLKYSCAVFIASNSTNIQRVEDNPVYWSEEGIWSPILEEYVLGTKREKRVMRMDHGPVTITKNGDEDDRESKIYNTKIVNNVSGSNKPPKQVSETDLYLLSAIEKLVHKVDSMEKRLRRVEEMLYYVMAGNRIDQDPCPDNFTRIGESCYFFGFSAGREYDWKAANLQCRKLNAALAEFETIEENQDIIAYIQENEYLKGETIFSTTYGTTHPPQTMIQGKDFWTGGLNPGLLWIWSNSARPVSTKNNQGSQNGGVSGNGRCLRIAYNSKMRSYAYKASDCSVRYHYICEMTDNSSINEIQRIAKKNNI